MITNDYDSAVTEINQKLLKAYAQVQSDVNHLQENVASLRYNIHQALSKMAQAQELFTEVVEANNGL